jgi:hypothetical protein
MDKKAFFVLPEDVRDIEGLSRELERRFLIFEILVLVVLIFCFVFCVIILSDLCFVDSLKNAMFH